MRLTYLDNRRNIFNTLWTDALVERLTALWVEGYSASQIADELKGHGRITRSAVIGKVHRLNLPARKPRQPARRKPYTRRGNGVPKPPTPPPRPRPPEPPQLVPPHMRELPLFKLKPQHCRWPLGGFLEVAKKFCAADTEGEVYCPFHMRMARVPMKGMR